MKDSATWSQFVSQYSNNTLYVYISLYPCDLWKNVNERMNDKGHSKDASLRVMTKDQI
jgi:hypothetical protein